MLKLALTGGIATGKSYVLKRLHDSGVPTLDADDLSHGVTTSGTEATRAISDRFGSGVLDESGAVDRRTLGQIVFADEQARRDLEAIVHPPVYRAIEAAMRGFERTDGASMAVVAIPLLFETGRQGDFDAVIATVCSVPVQLRRLMERGLSEVEARRRIDAQMPAEDKAARADHVIRTDGSFHDTDAAVRSLLQTLRQTD